MRRLMFRLAVALLTFIIGVAVSFIWSVFHPSTRIEENRSSLLGPARQPPVVSSIGAGGGGISAGNFTESESSFSTSESFSNGTTLDQTSIIYSSPERARSELQKRLKDAVEIIKREPVLDERGRQVGERVLAMFASQARASVIHAELLSTNGSEFISLSGSSINEMLEESGLGRRLNR
jgi:hypothetical protein